MKGVGTYELLRKVDAHGGKLRRKAGRVNLTLCASV